MSFLDKVAALSVTVACTVGLELLMFPTGLTEVMVTPLRPPRVGPPLAPDLVLGLDLPAVLLFLGLPTPTPFFCRSFSMLSYLNAAERVSAPPITGNRGLLPPGPSASRRTFDGLGSSSAYRAAAEWRMSSILGKSHVRGRAASGQPGCGSVYVTYEVSSRSGSGTPITSGQ